MQRTDGRRTGQGSRRTRYVVPHDQCMLPLYRCAAGRVPRRDPAQGPGDPRHGRQDEDVGGTTPGLPAPHRGAEGVAVRQRGALQHAAGGRGGDEAADGREEPADREEDAAAPTGTGEGSRRDSRDARTHGHQGQEDQRVAKKGKIFYKFSLQFHNYY